MAMEKKSSGKTDPAMDPIEEAMARARLKRMRARPVRRLPTSVGPAARRVTRKHLKGTGSPIAKLQDDWPELIGERLSTLCRPEKLSGPKTGRTLTLKVLPAAAALIQHESETIRQRISVAASGNITKLKIIQGALTKRAGAPRKPIQPLSAEQRAALEADTAGIENPALKAAIVALGRAVLTDKN